MRRLLLGAGGLGMVLFCSGCTLLYYAQKDLAVASLILANVVLIPLFVYLIYLRSRASAAYKRSEARKAAREQRELEALASLGQVSPPEPAEPEQ